MIYEVRVANYGQERELNCTEEEREIFRRVCEMFPEETFRLVRVSPDYVTIRRGAWDIVRCKYTMRAKWLMFPTLEAKQVKHYIDGLQYVEDYEAAIQESIAMSKKYK